MLAETRITGIYPLRGASRAAVDAILPCYREALGAESGVCATALSEKRELVSKTPSSVDLRPQVGATLPRRRSDLV